ncbi:MAG: transposase-like protein [Verrucomicrobiales bacterium]|jgi:transposase-like protein
MKKINNRIKERAITAYSEGRGTLQSIATEVGVATSTVYSWVTQNGTNTRRPGRPEYAAPGERDQSILKLTETESVKAITERFDLTRQRVYAILARWDFPPAPGLGPHPPNPQSSRPTPKAARLKENRDAVISFRITHAQLNNLRLGLDTRSDRRRLSANKVARRIVLGAIERDVAT